MVPETAPFPLLWECMLPDPPGPVLSAVILSPLIHQMSFISFRQLILQWLHRLSKVKSQWAG